MIAARASAAALALSLCAMAASAAPLRFSIPEGNLANEFLRDGAVAAHLVLRSGSAPRLVFAFPAGNSGAALWFGTTRGPVAWAGHPELRPVESRLPDGGVLRGVQATVTAMGGPVTLRQSLLGSIRVIRDFEHSGAIPPGIGAEPDVSGRTLTWRRRRLDGAAGYSLSMEVLAGRLSGGGAAPVAVEPGHDGRIEMRVTALTGDPPLTPLAADRLLNDAAADDTRLRQVLAFLSYEDKLLAGSWRFDTYFGRDTLMSVRLLSPVLRPEVSEAALESVLWRLSPDGEVAHEEDIGEYAVLRRRQAGLPGGDAPLFDYRMIDDDFLLSIVTAHYLLDTGPGRARARAFLARGGIGGESNGAVLARNLRFVVKTAAPFARGPGWRNLVSLKPGTRAGDWRDSEEGLGHGRYPYDVNGVFVPAALGAIDRLLASGLLDSHADPDAAGELGQAAGMAAVWRREAPRLFDVELQAATAREAVRGYAARNGIDASPALSRMDGEAIRYRGVALGGDGKPIPVLNSDEAFALLFLDLSPAEAGRIARTLSRPFPAGLLTGIGLLVANPAYAPAALQPAFGRDRYHGTVVWSWQQALYRAGIERQLARDDLPESIRDELRQSLDSLRKAMATSKSMRGSELWSWTQVDGAYAVVPFGQGEGHETESNAAQLWSTVHLAWPVSGAAAGSPPAPAGG